MKYAQRATAPTARAHTPRATHVETTLSLRVLMLLRLRIHANRGHRPSALAAAAAAVVRERRVSVALRTQYEATGDTIAVHFADRKVIEEIPKERKAKYWGGWRDALSKSPREYWPSRLPQR